MEKQTGKHIKRLCTNGGGEYTSKEFENFLKQEGIFKETTVPYSPQSNSVVERANHTIVEQALAYLMIPTCRTDTGQKLQLLQYI